MVNLVMTGEEIKTVLVSETILIIRAVIVT